MHRAARAFRLRLPDASVLNPARLKVFGAFRMACLPQVVNLFTVTKPKPSGESGASVTIPCINRRTIPMFLLHSVTEPMAAETLPRTRVTEDLVSDEICWRNLIGYCWKETRMWQSSVNEIRNGIATNSLLKNQIKRTSITEISFVRWSLCEEFSFFLTCVRLPWTSLERSVSTRTPLSTSRRMLRAAKKAWASMYICKLLLHFSPEHG